MQIWSRRRIETVVLAFLGLTHVTNELAGNLSSGQKKLLELLVQNITVLRGARSQEKMIKVIQFHLKTLLKEINLILRLLTGMQQC